MNPMTIDTSGTLPAINLDAFVEDVSDALVSLDGSRVPFKNFQPGVGPYGEPQLVRAIADYLNGLPRYRGQARTKRTPDLLVPGSWALEFKIARPFGDNGLPAENWSVNLLHPYAGNTSAIGDCLKLLGLAGAERKAVIAIGYEHSPAQIDLAPLFAAFELLATSIAGIRLGARVETLRSNLVHPVHQRARVAAWEIIGRTE
jgi:hypothetical protein